MNNIKGFTLVELVIVIVIVGILSIVAVPIYRSYTRKSIATEGKSLLGVVQMSQRAYFAEHSCYLDVGETSFNEILDVDARANKYFTTFTVTTSGQSGDRAVFTATTNGIGGATGISLTIIARPKSAPSLIDSGIN